MMNDGDAVIALPKWAWAIISSVLVMLLTGAIGWGSWMTSTVMEIRESTITRKEVAEVLQSNSPYLRDKAGIEGRLMAAERLLDRVDTDSRRLSDSIARMEAKLDIVIGGRKAQ